MAYNVERFSNESAEKICKAFFAMFTADADCFTNWNIATDFKKANSWANISDSTFDFTLGGIDSNTAGVICIGDDE